MHLVHVIQRPGDGRAWDAARAHARDHRVTVVLLQDAVLDPPGTPRGAERLEVLAGERDMAARGLAGRHAAIGDEELIDLMFSADRVISW